MPTNFDFLIIETYTELMAVIAGLAIVATILRLLWIWRRARRNEARANSPVGKKSKTGHASNSRRAPANAQPNGADFIKLATVITEANERADNLTQTHTAAALKLDTAEMAVIRLHADIDGIMAVSGKTKQPAPAATAASVTPGATLRGLPAVSKPNRAA